LHGKGGISLVAMLVLAGYALSQLSGGLRERKAGRSETSKSVPAPTLAIERTLILVELGQSSDSTFDPPTVADEFNGLILSAKETAVTLLVAPLSQDVAATIEALIQRNPLRLQVWASPTVLIGPDGPVAITAVEEELTHATS
jgi:hypothetical protein